MRFFAVALFFIRAAASYGQATEVPHKMRFAGMTLTIRDDARREMQKDVDALTKYPRYLAIKVERAKTYFPIIEKIFEEERLPDDFKFLALQESALISDAVSVTDAVGFWQFKDFTAMELGLRMDQDVDERVNLISSTRAAAKYLKQNNYMFNNWLYALQSYQMGAGGVQRAVGDQYNGAKHMEITSETYWYVKKYLAHKVAFENAISGEAQVKVTPFEISGRSLHDIAVEVSIDEEQLMEYNKWVKKGVVPSDKSYTVLIPSGTTDEFKEVNVAVASIIKNKAQAHDPIVSSIERPQLVPEIKINDLLVIMARDGESVTTLANRAAIELSSFIKYNDISIDHNIRVGSYYFIEKKKSKSLTEFYRVDTDEDLWRISQLTGVQLKKLKKYNRFTDDQRVPSGSMVWLSGAKPNSEMMPEVEEVALIDDEEEFEWTAKPEKKILQVVANDENTNEVLLSKEQRNNGSEVIEKTSPTLTYTVKQGETLYSIAKINKVDLLSLLQWNDLAVTDGLKPGQVLKMASASDGIEGTSKGLVFTAKVHEVQASDTLYSISRKYSISIKELMEWNKKGDLSLTVGEMLKIPQR
ncbi:MAG: LysM peptidoglycan-binding domain-containing protein [Bacteroidia bacterium]|nr:LysM peptidoglycan-binding domain-containing protein [Bacteroidia bacterium]